MWKIPLHYLLTVSTNESEGHAKLFVSGPDLAECLSNSHMAVKGKTNIIVYSDDQKQLSELARVIQDMQRPSRIARKTAVYGYEKL